MGKRALIVAGLATSVAASVAAQERSSPATGLAAVRIRVAYYLNDKERDAGRECKLALLVDGALVQATSSDGRTFTYQPEPRQKGMLLRCGGELHFAKPAYDCTGNTCDTTVVVSIYTQPTRLSADRQLEGGTRFDEHYPLLVGYLEGRRMLREKWLKLPALAKVETRVAGVVYESPDGQVCAATTWIR